MIEILKMRHRGCCDNCLETLEEKDIYSLDAVRCKIEICKECLDEFVDEIRNVCPEAFERKE